MGLYDLETERVKRLIGQHGARRAAIQLPDGLRPQLAEITEAISEAGVEPIVLASSCYGACDLADEAAKRLGCDVLIHYGHADMGLKPRLPTLYVEARMLADPRGAVERALPLLSSKRIGLITTVQHLSYMPDVVELLRSRGFSPSVGEPGFRAKYRGQILGCDWGCATSVAGLVDELLYIGTGKFHPLGAALATGKRVVMANPLTEEVEELNVEPSNLLARRRAMVSRAAGCRRFGVIVSTKPGQARLRLASRLVEDLGRAGLEAHLLVVDEVQPERLRDFRLDAYVCAACPRIPIDDAERFDAPVLTPFEAWVLLGRVDIEPYQLDHVEGEDF